MGNSNGEVGFEYWWRWQVPVCALIIVVPAAISFVLIKRRLRSGDHLSHGCLWIPCWRGMNPKWLLLYRVFAFISMALILYQIVASFGLFVFYFYTQWTFTLVMVYFAIGTVISARGCWMNSEIAPGHITKLDPFQWFGFTYFAWWTVIYITFQWIVHDCGLTRWPYPFLELATPWAPLWYLGMALFHIPCYDLYILLTKAMVSGFSRLFPQAYIRLNEVMLQREKTA